MHLLRREATSRNKFDYDFDYGFKTTTKKNNKISHRAPFAPQESILFTFLKIATLWGQSSFIRGAYLLFNL